VTEKALILILAATLRQSAVSPCINAAPRRSSPDRPRLPQLPISGTIFRVRYESDDGKAAANLRKHGVDFVDAIAAPEDTNRVEEIDTRLSTARNGFRSSEWRTARRHS
jgi:hypothetical protein